MGTKGYKNALLSALVVGLLLTSAALPNLGWTSLTSASSEAQIWTGNTEENLAPSADSWVELSNPSTNKGSDSAVHTRVDWDERKSVVKNLRRAYLKFDLSGLPPGVMMRSVKLHLYRKKDNDLPSVYRTTDNWAENGITWNNQPGPGALENDNGTVSGNWIEWGITSYAASEYAGDKVFSVVLKFKTESGSDQHADFSSREGPWGQRPWLEISYISILHDVEVSISPSYQSGVPGTWLTYTVTVKNTGTENDNFDLAVGDNSGWGPTLDDNVLEVPAGENRQTTLNIIIPKDVENGVEDNITITATSQIDNTVSASASCIAIVTAVRGVEVSISPENQGGPPGETLTYEVTVTNIGNVEDDFSLTVDDNASWPLALSENLLENVQMGENRVVTLNVTVPENVAPSTEDNIKVTGTSQGDPSVSDFNTCIAHATEAVQPPSAPTLKSPADGTITNDNTPTFEWTKGENADSHRLLVDNDSDFSLPEENVLLGATDNTYTISALGLADENYSWKVIAINAIGENESSTWTFLIDTIAPATPTLVSPQNNAVKSDLIQTFVWTEPEAGVTYDIQIDNEASFTSPYVHEKNGLAENSYTYTFASNGVYYWRVRAADPANNQSPWSDNFKLTIQAPLGPPTLYLPTDGTITNDNTPTFEWTIGVNADNHRLLVDNDADFSLPEENVLLGATDNTYTISAPGLADENYSWKVIAINAIGENGSLTWTFVIDTVAPAIPTLVSPENNAVENALTQTFTWTEPEADVTYDIQIDNEASFTSPYVHENTGLADNSYTYTFTSNGVYYWRVRAADAANNQSLWGDNFKLTIQASPGQPTLYLPTDGIYTNDNTPTFEWIIGANVDNHRLLVDNDPDFSSPEENRIVLDNYYTIADENSLPDDNYSWKVIAINMLGENQSSLWIFVIDTVPPAAPSLVSPPDGTITDDDTPTFDWSDVAGAENYDLLVDDDADFSSPEIQVTVPESTYTPTIRLSDGKYWWKVRVRDAAGNVSDWSSTWTLTTKTVVRGVEVSISPESKSGLPGETLTYGVTVKNTGSIDDTYTLSAVGTEDWSVSVEPTQLTLAAGATGNATLSVVVPPDASENDSMTVTVSVISEAYPSVTDSDTCRTVVKGVPVAPGIGVAVPLAILVLLILLAILLLAYLSHRRRKAAARRRVLRDASPGFRRWVGDRDC